MAANSVAISNAALGPVATSLTGTLYEDLFGLGAAAIALYRLDTGHSWAPFGRFELGAGWNHYGRLQLLPNGTQYFLPGSNSEDFSLGARLMVGFEYRFADRWLASVGVAARRNFGSLTMWQFDVPVSVGYVW